MVQDPIWGTEHIPDNVDTGSAVANTTLDEIIAGVANVFAIDLTSANFAFSSDDDYVLNFTFQMTGNTVARDVTILTAIKKFAVFHNQGTAIVSLKLGTATILIEPGEIATVYSDGVTNSLIRFGSNFALDSSLSGVATETGTTHSPDITQANKYILYTNAAAISATIEPNATEAFLIGTVLTFEQNNTGVLTLVAGSGVTLNVPASQSLVLLERYSVASAVKVAINTWTVMGQLT